MLQRLSTRIFVASSRKKCRWQELVPTEHHGRHLLCKLQNLSSTVCSAFSACKMLMSLLGQSPALNSLTAPHATNALTWGWPQHATLKCIKTACQQRHRKHIPPNIIVAKTVWTNMWISHAHIHLLGHFVFLAHQLPCCPTVQKAKKCRRRVTASRRPALANRTHVYSKPRHWT